ncbi:MAG: RidA family protein [Planctomycetota bacterium]|nr:RidA family protein [Planctomycetota bacterium]
MTVLYTPFTTPMNTSVTANPRGGYRFLPGIEPYSSGVVAEPGWEIVHATLARPLVWHDGLDSIRRHLEHMGRNRHALCGVELRCPEPFSMDGFVAFNRQYRSLLEDWDMLVDGANPIARTNVAPVENAPNESVVFGFSYTQPSNINRTTFVVAGGGELRGSLDAKNIVRVGETSEDAIIEKARCVVEIMRERLASLGDNELLSQINVYTAHNLRRVFAEEIIPVLPAAAHLGVRWYYSRPPVRHIEFEMDMRGVVRDVVIDFDCSDQ